MKHAIMVEGHGDTADILQSTIDWLDDSEIDFSIHWDKKYKKPKLSSNKSKLFFVPRHRVVWGTDTQIKAELELFRSVRDTGGYEFVHLISANDFPLMTVDYFKNYFNKNKNRLFIGIVDFNELTEHRTDWYYPFPKLNYRSLLGQRLVLPIVRGFNKLFRVSRLKNQDITPLKGANWFSAPSTVLNTVLEFPKLNLFMHSFLADEMLLQTITGGTLHHPASDEYNTTIARYIDWTRGIPYEFQPSDVDELLIHLNSTYAFVRKVKNIDVVNSLISVINN